MITEQALQEAIAECLGNRNPTKDTCMMLAAFYIIQERLYPERRQPDPSYSFAEPPEQPEQVRYDSGTEFSEAIRGRDVNEVLPILDDAMDAVKTMLPRLYNGIMHKLED